MKHGKVLVFSNDQNKNDHYATARAKLLLDSVGIECEEVDLQKMSQEDKTNLTLAIQLDSGYTQFPSIYFGHEHIGGLDDLKGYLGHENSMKKIIEENGVVTSESASEEAEDESKLRSITRVKF